MTLITLFETRAAKVFSLLTGNAVLSQSPASAMKRGRTRLLFLNQSRFEKSSPSLKGPHMRAWPSALLLATLASAGCGTHPMVSGDPQSLTPARAAAVEDGVRVFMRAVAHDVTQVGPAAWRRHFADSPSFFMASEGRLVFPNSAAATAAIQDLTHTIKQIELNWGEDLRVDPLTPDLAVVAASYHEVLVNTAGRRVEETGFFT
ncbi:MAG: hypothetical protein WBN92_07620, partial [Terriglobia bacterium]